MKKKILQVFRKTPSSPTMHTHNRALRERRTLHREQHEINTFYEALKALMGLGIHLLCLRKVSLALYSACSDKKKDSELAATF